MVSHRTGGKLSWTQPDTAVPNIWSYMPTKNALHPNEKPIPLVSQFVMLTTEEDDIVLDPFCGSGTTLIAARDCGRKAIGIELEERYCAIAASRLEQGVLFGQESPT